ncbi:hypothetical protein GCM10010096_08620 [Alcaligenes pakistanensis]|uniref:Uncharacterized protein n=1 Tax=Alcaligenes pakistanensis TaxID=1482717 RepID=A0A8H9IG00_9BURK|nr:hypothetical protein [Alcaligenes pakistanensis]GHC40390.1 hypothetical protein GCM10010096_08620 [Alcaligenes pakistanensis]
MPAQEQAKPLAALLQQAQQEEKNELASLQTPNWQQNSKHQGGSKPSLTAYDSCPTESKNPLSDRDHCKVLNKIQGTQTDQNQT